jgi:hypothetical protein
LVNTEIQTIEIRIVEQGTAKAQAMSSTFDVDYPDSLDMNKDITTR